MGLVLVSSMFTLLSLTRICDSINLIGVWKNQSFLKICIEKIEEPWCDEAKVTHAVMYVSSTFSRFRGTE